MVRSASFQTPVLIAHRTPDCDIKDNQAYPAAAVGRLSWLRMGAAGCPPRVAVTAIAWFVVLLLAAPTAQARSDFFGVNPGPPPDHADYAAINATNVKTVRFLLPWMVIEKNRGERDWADTDELVGGLASNGLRPVPFAFGSPSWTRAGGFAHPPLNTKSARLGWESFLKAAVRRYGPGGSYWKAPYHQQFGSGATPWPITSWQIWNEPNPRWNFAPGTTVEEAAQLYARLVHVSHDAIRSVDRHAEIVTAGFITQKDPYVYEFLRDFYSVPGIKDDFDTLAQHAYAPTVDQVRTAIKRVRDVMAKHNDRATPMWITELGWGSDPPDGEGINLGPEGQANMLNRTFNLILAHRSAWNVQRLYWFDWRDPAPGSHYAEICGRCGSAGLTSYDRAPKPAYDAFLSFAAETTPPLVSITGGPADGARINDVTPSFSLASSEVGSSFACRIDAGGYKPCASPRTTPEARRRHPHVRGTGDRRGRQPERPRLALVHGRLTASAGSANRPGHPEVPGEQQQPQAERFGAGGLDGEALQDRRLHRRSGSDEPRRQVRIAGDHGPGRRQHVDQLPGDGGRRRRQRVGVLVRSGLRRGLDRATDDDHGRALGHDDRLHPHLRLRLQRSAVELPLSLRLQAVRALLRAGTAAHPPDPAGGRPAHLLGAGARPGAERRSDGRPAQLHRHPLSATPQGRRRTGALRAGRW